MQPTRKHLQVTSALLIFALPHTRARSTPVHYKSPLLWYPHEGVDPSASFHGDAIVLGSLYRGRKLRGLRGDVLLANIGFSVGQGALLRYDSADEQLSLLHLSNAAVLANQFFINFIQDQAGELYLVTYDYIANTGNVFALE